jgi:hypothetical protein
LCDPNGAQKKTSLRTPGPPGGGHGGPGAQPGGYVMAYALAKG